MMEEYVDKAWEMLKKDRNINPHLLHFRLKINLEFAQKVCHQVWLRQRNEARAAASDLDNFGFDPQLQRVAKRNLEKFKQKKRKDK